MILVKKRNGRLEELDVNKINKCVERACEGVEDVSASEVALDAQIAFYNKITTSEIDESLILAARSKIEKEYNYSYVASRLLLNTMYKEVFNEGVDSDIFNLQFQKGFITFIKDGVKSGALDKRMVSLFDLKELAIKLMYRNDKLFNYFGLRLLKDRYLKKQNRKLVELPQYLWMRVAMGLSLLEKNPQDQAIKFYNKISELRYLPSTPTLFNSGTTRSQLSSCFLSTTSDSISGIFGTCHSLAHLSKYSGGLGLDISTLRATGSLIRGTSGHSTGIIGWIKCFNAMISNVDQGGGKRKGALNIFLEPWHLDHPQFLDLRKNVGDERFRAHETHFSNWIPDLFMELCQKEGNEWYLFCPDECKGLTETYGQDFKDLYNSYVEKAKKGQVKNFKVVDAKEHWKDMLKSIFETGYPMIAFKDPSNLRYSNNHVGLVRSSNLCQEILLHTEPSKYDKDIKTETGEIATCNLSSINLSAHFDEKGEINFDKLAESVKTAMRSLDNVIDINFYPVEDAEVSNISHRPVGLGVMGWHDLFLAKGISYDSEEAIKICDELQEFISYKAIEASSDLAVERGKYSSFEGSLWDRGILPIDSYQILMDQRNTDISELGLVNNPKLDWERLRNKIKAQGMRNSNTLAIAPTASISYLVDTSPSVDPYNSVLYTYSGLSGKNVMVNRYFQKHMKELGLWNLELLNKVKLVDGNLDLIEELPSEIKNLYKRAYDLNIFNLIKCAAVRQKWIDMGQSFNIFINTSSLKKLNDIFYTAWKVGLKTTYYLRNLEKSSTEKLTTKIEVKLDNDTENKKVCNIDDNECLSCQ